MKLIAALLIVVVAIAPPTKALLCRTNNTHSICIYTIKRSAKYPWEYRAAVSVDGEIRPVEIYNCRQRVRRTRQETVPFEHDGAGELICNFKR